MKGSNEILGGYNPIKCTKDRFSFKNSYTRIENFILSRVKNKTYATVYIIVKFMNHHLVLVTLLTLHGGNCYNRSYCKQSDYEKPIRESVDKYEIFQIIKN